MPSFREQMQLHEASRRATTALEAASRAEISRIFMQWRRGEHSNRSVRFRLENVVRNAYRTSAGVAREVAQESSGLPGWLSHEVFITDYLDDLLKDVRRNLRAYKAGTMTEAQAIYRMGHSAGVAAQRGYTDQLIASYSELEDFGLRLRKYWVANFVDNTPCPACVRLHGTSVGIHEAFRAETAEPSVYRDLQGPPRHPQCKCKIFIFITSLENAFEEPNFEAPQYSPQMMTTDEVKQMSKGVFASVVSALRVLIRVIRGGRQ